MPVHDDNQAPDIRHRPTGEISRSGALPPAGGTGCVRRWTGYFPEMSEHKAMITWKRSGPDFRAGRYSRAHTWRFDGGAEVPASASPSVVPAPWSNPAGVDPEEAFVASVASCHMLWWLSLAAQEGFDVEDYADEAIGTMARNEAGASWISAVVLNPRIRYGARAPTPADEARLHERAHALCFIANSIKTRVIVPGAGDKPAISH
jgi:organic hydroperoxide reductase OsmC/OhrA